MDHFYWLSFSSQIIMVSDGRQQINLLIVFISIQLILVVPPVIWNQFNMETVIGENSS